MATEKSEKYEVRRLGAVPTRNSGRGHTQKADGIVYLNGQPFITTDVKEYSVSYSLSISKWAKLVSDAKVNGFSQPCFQIVLGNEDPRVRIVAVSETFFLRLLNYYMEGHSDE
jgi:hypothetical protein